MCFSPSAVNKKEEGGGETDFRVYWLMDSFRGEREGMEARGFLIPVWVQGLRLGVWGVFSYGKGNLIKTFLAMKSTTRMLECH